MRLFFKVLAIGLPVLLLYIFSNRILYSEATKSLSDRLVLHTLARNNQNEGDGVDETNDLRPSPDHNPQPSGQINSKFNESQSDIRKINEGINRLFTQAVLLSENNTRRQLYEEMNEALKKKPVENNVKTTDIATQESKDSKVPLMEKNASIEEKGKITQENETPNVNLISGLLYNQSTNADNSLRPGLPDKPIQSSESASPDTTQKENVTSAEQKTDNLPQQLPVKDNNVPDNNITQLSNNDTSKNETSLTRLEKAQETESNNSSPELTKFPVDISKSAELKTTWNNQSVNEPKLGVYYNVNQSKIVSRKKRQLYQEEKKISENRSPTELFEPSTSTTDEKLDVNATETDHVSNNKPPQPLANDSINDVSLSNEVQSVKSEVFPQEKNSSRSEKLKENITRNDVPPKQTAIDNDNNNVKQNNTDVAGKHELPPQENNSSSPVNQDVNTPEFKSVIDPTQLAANDSVYVESLIQPINAAQPKNELRPQESNNSSSVNQDTNTTAAEPVTDNNDPTQHAANDSVYVENLIHPNNVVLEKNETTSQESNSSSPVNQDMNTTTAEPVTDNNDLSQHTTDDSVYVVSLIQPNNDDTEKNESSPQETQASNSSNQGLPDLPKPTSMSQELNTTTVKDL